MTALAICTALGQIPVCAGERFFARAKPEIQRSASSALLPSVRSQRTTAFGNSEVAIARLNWRRKAVIQRVCTVGRLRAHSFQRSA